MKMFLAQGESRNFSFLAIGKTQQEAEHAIIETFEAHARQYDLPLDWWQENADFFVMEVETGARYRDRSKLNEKWYQDEEKTND